MDSLLRKKIENGDELCPADLKRLLLLENQEDLQILYQAAYKMKLRHIGNKVSLRGLIEFSNICTKNCYYCGIRKGNHAVQRYCMTPDEILAEAETAWKWGLGSVVLQSGERSDRDFTDFVEQIVREIKRISNGELGITLSCGEQSEEVYRRWFEAGAHRYLLRIEAGDPEFYTTLHPADHSYHDRKQCLKTLKRCGYQTGSGVMIGLPGQTVDHLVTDLLFFRELDLDMIGMGPYIIHKDTPLAVQFPDFQQKTEFQLTAALKMIAVTRLFLKDVNIASTTALQALRDDGRELGIQAGANVIMPNVTDTSFRSSYQLYQGKPGVNDAPESGMTDLKKRLDAIGETILFNTWGDSPHFRKY
ncbi:MAG: [FeFe] hydrogenase H-cluster radical SAM maturase HydE [Lentisphaeria bacterium]|nr:[FeFe] hydrogenase H-cluster radical SAM maturase HydE [Lentisphaeria bacterium]